MLIAESGKLLTDLANLTDSRSLNFYGASALALAGFFQVLATTAEPPETKPRFAVWAQLVSFTLLTLGGCGVAVAALEWDTKETSQVWNDRVWPLTVLGGILFLVVIPALIREAVERHAAARSASGSPASQPQTKMTSGPTPHDAVVSKGQDASRDSQKKIVLGTVVLTFVAALSWWTGRSIRR